MATYKYQLETLLGEFGWEYDLTHASDDLARAHAKKVAEYSAIVRSPTVNALLVWRLGDESKLIARFIVKTVVTAVDTEVTPRG